MLNNDASRNQNSVECEYILEIEDLAVNYETFVGIVNAVNHVSLKLKPQKTLGLVGETGAGKTTLARSIMRLVPNPPGVVKHGQVRVNGLDIYQLTNSELKQVRGKLVSMIFQDPMTALNPIMRVGDQIYETVAVHNPESSKQENLKKVNEMLELVGIPIDRIKEYPHQFSGGMKQRVIIAIALACNPMLLLADEPTTALDVTIQAQILEIMKDLQKQYNMAMLLITHDLGIIAEFCDDVAVMYAGHIVEAGTLEDVFINTKHPYTEGLFRTLPNIFNRKEMLQPIPGLMPDPFNLPDGCPFASRCSYALDSCSVGQIEKIQVSGSHYVVCRRYLEMDFDIARRSRGE